MTRRIFFSTWVVLALFVQTAVFAMPCCYAMNLPAAPFGQSAGDQATETVTAQMAGQMGDQMPHQMVHDCDHMMGSSTKTIDPAQNSVVPASHMSTTSMLIADQAHSPAVEMTCPMAGVMLISQPLWFDEGAEHTLNDSGRSVLFATVLTLPISHATQRLERPPRRA